MSAANKSLWENAPATREIQMAPVRAIELARAKLADWRKVIHDVEALLQRVDVSSEDKADLLVDRKTAMLNMLACEGIIAHAEAESVKQASNFQKKAGWML